MGRSARRLLLVTFWAIFCFSGCQSVDPARQVATQTSSTAPLSAWVEIDTEAFERNVRKLTERLAPKTLLCAVLKADAYGHGIAELAPSLSRLSVPCAAVAANEEAQALRLAGFRGRVIRIRTATLEEIEAASLWEVEEMLGNLDLAREVANRRQGSKRTLRYHLTLNSAGMSRNGLDLSTSTGKREALSLLALPGLEVVGIMTHFPVEDPTDIRKGLDRFLREVNWLVPVAKLDRAKLLIHAANSFAALEVPESRLDLARVGESLYSGTITNHPEFEQVMSLKARVASVNRYPKGNSVSYDRTFVLRRDSRLANVPIGYANGYRRSLSNRAHVLIRGKRFAVVGRVTMNTLMVDVTGASEISAGDEVVLFGAQGDDRIGWKDLEQATGSIAADVLTAWGKGNVRRIKPVVTSTFSDLR